MFTVKHFPLHGPRRVLACESFEHDQDAGIVHLNRPDEDLELEPGDTVFMENMHGKTVYAIRPPRGED